MLPIGSSDGWKEAERRCLEGIVASEIALAREVK